MAAENALLRFEPGLMIWTVVVFLFTLAVLRKIAWKPLLESLDEREKTIHDAVTKAEKAHEEAEKAIAEARQNTEETLRKGELLVAEAREEAEQLRRKLIEEAKAESRKVLEQGLKRIEAQQRVAMEEVRRSAAELAVQAAGKLIRSSMTAQEQRRIVDEFLEKLPEDRVN